MDALTFSQNALTAKLYIKDKQVPLVICNTESQNVEALAKALSLDAACNLLAITGFDWNDDLSPWFAPPIFKSGAAFEGRALSYLNTLETKFIPSIIENFDLTPPCKIIAGYSLSGLFSLYAAFCSDYFSGVVCASGSLWFPGFVDYARTHKLSSNVLTVYFSLGNKERFSSNPILREVYDNTQLIFHSLDNVESCFCLNRGNHFTDTVTRTASGIKWVVDRTKICQPKATKAGIIPALKG